MKQKMLLLFLILLLFVRCDTTEPPAKGSLSLTLEDVSCTEAWIKLTTTNLPLPASINLLKNNAVSKVFILNTQDSLLYIDSLLPKQTYVFQVTSILNPASSLSSNKATATTLDTTSHAFTWQTFTFGQHSSSSLYDVAIIDENNIWAVGEIYMKDSLGRPDPNAYNAVHWNGSEWKLKRIYFPTVCGSTSLSSYPAGAIFAFNDGQIWISSTGDKIARLQNGVQIDKFCLPSNVSMSINKLWGSSSSDLYVVGNGGGVAHYNGSIWTKIESSTTINLTDIYGTPDGKEVWACGWNNSDGHTALIKIVNINSEMIYNSFNPNNNLPYNGFISSLWSNGKQFFWLTGTSKGIVKHSYTNKNFTKLESFGIQYFPYRIRGAGSNDISTSGDAAMIWHYNGFSWRSYEELLNLDDRVRSMDMKEGILVAVGLRYESILGEGLIILGRK